MNSHETSSLDFLISRNLLTRGILGFIDYQPPVKLRRTPEKLSNHQVRIELDQLKIFDYFDSPNAPGFQHYFKAETLSRTFKVVLDWHTGLMWQYDSVDKPMSHQEAFGYLDEINCKQYYAGFDDWRLPTVAEAASLIERHPIDDLHINFAFSRNERYVWTADYVDEKEAWVVSYFQGFVMHDLKEKNYFVRMVRSII